MVGGVPDVITCAKFQIEIFMGYDFTGGRIFDFCIDFSMGLTTVQRYCAACDDCIPRCTYFMTVVLRPTWAYEQRDKLLTLGHASIGVDYVSVN